MRGFPRAAGSLALLAAVAAGPIPAAVASAGDGGEEPFLQELGREIKEARQQIAELESRLRREAKQAMMPYDASSIDPPYPMQQDLRERLFDARLLQDTRRTARRALQDLYDRIDATSLDGDARQALRSEVEDRFRAYYARRLEHFTARRTLAVSLLPDSRREAEMLLTLREQQLSDARQALLATLSRSGIDWPADELP